jgi:hypothetical protein
MEDVKSEWPCDSPFRNVLPVISFAGYSLVVDEYRAAAINNLKSPWGMPPRSGSIRGQATKWSDQHKNARDNTMRQILLDLRCRFP